MAKHITGYVIGVIFCLGLLLTTLLSLAAPSANIGAAKSPTRMLDPEVTETMIQLEELISDKNCQLPCWWGWTLGEDDFEKIKTDAQSYFDQKAVENWEGVKYSEGYAAVSKAFFNSPEDELSYLGFLLWFDEQDQVFTAFRLRIEPPLTSLDVSPYMPSGILKTYGLPEEITIFPPTEIYSYQLTLKYFSLGLYIKYYVNISEDQRTSEDELLICASTPVVSLYFWGQVQDLPESSPPATYAIDITARSPYERDIEDILELDIPTFVERFTNADNDCVKTGPIEWPTFSSATETPN